MFLRVSDQKLEPSDKPLVMFKEMPAGAPQAVQAWFYPGETTGYEFVYPHDQALKIAKAAHTGVLAIKDNPQTSTDAERMASMKSAEVTRIDENDKPVSTDEQLKDSSSLHPSNTAAATTTASPATTTARSNAAATPQPTTSEPANPQSNSQSTTARANTASSANAAQSNAPRSDRKSTRLNSSHSQISYAVFCLKKKTNKMQVQTLLCGRQPFVAQVVCATVGPAYPDRLQRGSIVVRVTCLLCLRRIRAGVLHLQ